MKSKLTKSAIVPQDAIGRRLDQVAAELFPDYSRAAIQAWIKSGELLVDSESRKLSSKVLGGERLELDVELLDVDAWEPEDIPLDIVFADEHIIVVNKPAGLVVHPAAGHYQGTLLNALIHFDAELKKLPRAGIVHRLDKDTSGLMVVARSLSAQNELVKQLQAKSVYRQYVAIAHGVVKQDGVVDLPIGRDSRNRKKMAVVAAGHGKTAVTHYLIERQYKHFTRLDVRLETGRTHQIRVHMSHIGHGLIGDPQYTSRANSSQGLPDILKVAVQNYPRQALHAQTLGLVHPVSGAEMTWKSELPSDLSELVALLDKYD